MSRDRRQPVVGVFALQGDHAHHRASLARHGIETRPVRRMAHLEDIDGLVLPGGESTTMLNLLRVTGFEEPFGEWLRRRPVPVFATCAGLILLASDVQGPAQRSYRVLDVDVARNGYGRQVHSGTSPLVWNDRVAGRVGSREIDRTGVFIRAPRITRVGDGVEVLARRDGDPALIRDGDVFGCVFHPELVDDHPATRLFLDAVHAAMGDVGAAEASTARIDTLASGA